MAWPSGEDAKSSFEVLLDIFAEVPGILHDLDILRLQAGRASIAASALRHRTQTVLQALHTWRSRSVSLVDGLASFHSPLTGGRILATAAASPT